MPLKKQTLPLVVREVGDNHNLFVRLSPSTAKKLHEDALLAIETPPPPLKLDDTWTIDPSDHDVEFLPLEVTISQGEQTSTRTIYTSYNGGRFEFASEQHAGTSAGVFSTRLFVLLLLGQ
jgi:hypothetical protein